MNKISATLALAGLTLLLAGCVVYPLGMTEEEWVLLTPAQKLEARSTQAELDEQESKRRAEKKAREDALKLERERANRAYVRRLYRDGRYGDFIQCIIKNPLVDFHPGWRKAEPIAFTLAKREDKTIKIQGAKRSQETSIWVRFSNDGMRLKLCQYDQKEKPYGQCDKVVASHRDFRRGITHNIKLSDLIKGTLHCSLSPGRGMPTTIIIERD